MDRARLLSSTVDASALVGVSAARIFALPFGPRIMLDAERGSGGGAAPPAGGLKGLLAKRAGLRGEMRALIDAAEAADRDLTAEEQAQFDGLKAQVEALGIRIERLEEQVGAEAALDASRGAHAGRAPQLAGDRLHRRPTEAATQFENLGEFLNAVRFRPNDQRLSFVEGVGAERGEDGELRAELRMDDGAAGGFAIPPQFRNVLLQLTPQDAIVRPRAQVLEAGSPPDAPVTMPALDQTGAAPGNMYGGVQVQWIEEGALKPRTDLKIREITLTPHEVAGTMLITDKLLRNWQSASGLIERQLRLAMAQAEDLAFLRGNGVGKPLGILAAKACYRVPRTTAGQIKYNDLIAMMARLRGPGMWVYNRSCLPQLMALQSPLGQLIWAASAVAGAPNTLLGMPAMTNERNPQLGAFGDIWLADLTQYLIKDGSGPFVAASEHVYFETNKTVIKAFWNVDGSPWLTQPIADEGGYLSSPFVVLDVPSV